MLTFPRQALALNASMLRQERDAAQRRVANLLDQLSEVEMGSEAVVAAKDREIATLTETLNVWCCDVWCLGSSFALPLCLCLGWRFKVGLLDRQPFREHARVTHVTLLCSPPPQKITISSRTRPWQATIAKSNAKTSTLRRQLADTKTTLEGALAAAQDREADLVDELVALSSERGSVSQSMSDHNGSRGSLSAAELSAAYVAEMDGLAEELDQANLSLSAYESARLRREDELRSILDAKLDDVDWLVGENASLEERIARLIEANTRLQTRVAELEVARGSPGRGSPGRGSPGRGSPGRGSPTPTPSARASFAASPNAAAPPSPSASMMADLEEAQAVNGALQKALAAARSQITKLETTSVGSEAGTSAQSFADLRAQLADVSSKHEEATSRNRTWLSLRVWSACLC